MLIGILAGLTTCALWGLTFIAPRAVDPFSTFDLTVARYGIFGMASVLFMLHPRFRPRGLAARRWLVGLLLGGVGYVGYFVAAAYAVKLAGAAVPPLVIGTMPVLLALIANWRDRSVPWRSLASPLGLIVAGVAVVNMSVIEAAGQEGREAVLLGVLAASIALVVWIIYGLANAAVMSAPDAPDGVHWTGVQGIGAAIGSMMLLPLTSFSTQDIASAEMANFLAWALLMGLAGSWVATFCWVIASGRLPLALAAQLIVAETVFGLAYGFLFEMRWPDAAEWTGALLQLAGVTAAILLFSRPCVACP
ncbi:DMT family transporter [Sinorhizobium sp. RAC02]|uniref:DMT family transporter n=1 Tax=Sinorhizobium sp. RAC02 TaxID=1842534 RepID=UPI00083E0E3F|nr:DMT family transporter [Sinorhizobium sp. RAC02]AOF90340.1 eamA-like transporter family protein [Sinorhizobium sp. RAC02]